MANSITSAKRGSVITTLNDHIEVGESTTTCSTSTLLHGLKVRLDARKNSAALLKATIEKLRNPPHLYLSNYQRPSKRRAPSSRTNSLYLRLNRVTDFEIQLQIGAHRVIFTIRLCSISYWKSPDDIFNTLKLFRNRAHSFQCTYWTGYDAVTLSNFDCHHNVRSTTL